MFNSQVPAFWYYIPNNDFLLEYASTPLHSTSYIHPSVRFVNQIASLTQMNHNFFCLICDSLGDTKIRIQGRKSEILTGSVWLITHPCCRLLDKSVSFSGASPPGSFSSELLAITVQCCLFLRRRNRGVTISYGHSKIYLLPPPPPLLLLSTFTEKRGRPRISKRNSLPFSLPLSSVSLWTID